MPPPDVRTVVKDPDFLGLPAPEQQKVLQQIDPDFAGLPSDEQLKVVSGLGGTKPAAEAPVTATTTTPESTTPMERAGGYLYDKANQWVGSLQGLQADITGAVTGRKLTPGDRGWLDTTTDVLTAAAPLVAPIPTAAGIAAGAGARAAGADPALAELVDLGANLATGVGWGAAKGAQAVRGTNLARAEEALTGGTTEATAGEVIQSTVPKAAEQVRKEVQAATYTPAGQIAKQQGLGMMSDSPEAAQFGTKLADVEDKWGTLMSPAERRVVTQLQERITNPTASFISYDDLDQAKLALQKIKGASSTRGAIDEALDTMSAGTKAGELRAAGAAQWGTKVDPARKIARLVKTADEPATAFTRTVGRFTSAKRAERVRDLVGANSDEWNQITEGFYAKFIRGSDNPAILAKRWDRLPPEVRNVFDPNGEATKLIQRLPGPSGVTRTVARGLSFGGAAAAGVSGGKDILEGRWQSGMSKMLGAAALATQARPGAIFAAGAMPPLVRTGAAAAGTVLRNRNEFLAPETPEPPPATAPPPAESTPPPEEGKTASPSPAFLDEPKAPAPVAQPVARTAPVGAGGRWRAKPPSPGGYSPTDFIEGMVRRGWSMEEAAGAAANVHVESKFLPNINERAPLAGRGGYGFIQLTGPRRVAFETFLRRTGRAPDADAQMDWLAMERSGDSMKYGGPDERAGFRKAFAGGTPAQIGARFGAFVERPADLSATIRERRDLADRYYRLAQRVAQMNQG